MITLALLLLFAAPETPKPAGHGTADGLKLTVDAEEARKAGRVDDAIRLYRRALEVDVSSKEGWWALGTLYYQKDRYPECRDAFNHLSRLDPNSGVAWSMLGLCDFGTKNYTEALMHLERGRELGTGIEAIRRVALYHLAQLLTKAEAYEQALNVLAGFTRDATPDPRIVSITGIAALRRPLLLQDIPAADRELMSLAGKAFQDATERRVTNASEDFQALLGKYPSTPGVHYLYGTFLLQSEPDQAIGEFEEELRLSPTHVPALAALAFEYLRREDAKKGLPYARRAVELKPEAVAPHALLGRLLALDGDEKGGLLELQTAARIAPDDPQPRIALASLYSKLGRTEDAARERREFVRLSEKRTKATGAN